MRPFLIAFMWLILTVSCKEENDSLIGKYESLYGTWKPLTMSYDSSGVKVTRSIPYPRLVINENLTYQIYHDSKNIIENGNLRIKSQSDLRLELIFEAIYPIYSSFAGSHIFASSVVQLVSLTNDSLILKDADNNWPFPREFRFVKF
jgi:hypothetical protein